MTGARRSNRPPRLEEPQTWSSELPHVRLAWLSQPRLGESVSGDAVVVRRYGDGVLVSVVDALGHGPNAARVAEVATTWVHQLPAGDSVEAIVPAAHRALAGLRGAAALFFFISAHGIEACSVGNVELRSRTGRLPFVLTPGVLGQRLRSPKTCRTQAPLEDRFVLFSDGISGRFDLKAHASSSPEEVAAGVFSTHRHQHDDSTVVVLDVKL